MKTPLAFLNLLHQRKRTLLAMAGVAFAVILIFMQLGFRGSAEATATVLYDKLRGFDIVLTSSQYCDMNHDQTFPRQRLYQAQDVPGVAAACPLYLSFNYWRNPRTGIHRSIFMVGFDPTQRVFSDLPELNDPAILQSLRRRDTLVIDRKSHPDYGLDDGQMPAGTDMSEVGGRQVRVVGYFTLGTGFASDGSIITSDETFSLLQGGRPLDRVSLGLIRVQPGADPLRVQQALKKSLPADVAVLTRQQLEQNERTYWLSGKSIGILFTCGVLVALLVGVVFVYQIISTDIANHLSEYATLKAMGYGQRYLAGLVLQQALVLGVLSFLPGLGVALVLYEVTRHYAHVPIDMTLARAGMVFLLALGMCALSGLLSVRKLRSADPADLF